MVFSLPALLNGKDLLTGVAVRGPKTKMANASKFSKRKAIESTRIHFLYSLAVMIK